MKMNKLTAAVAALGIMAGVAQAANITVIYLTGSTAARGNIFTAMTTPGQIFPAGGSVVFPSGGNGSSSQIVYRGTLTNGDVVDIDCTWTGSEAGIAAVAGQGLTQSLPNDPNGSGPYALPGTGSGLTFFTPTAGATPTYSGAQSTLPNGVGNNNGVNVSVPDISMADTSQAVSRTPKATFPEHDYGIVGVVTFTLMKGYEKTPDATWNNLQNISTPQANVIALNGDLINASFATGVASDNTEGVAFIGRNFGSGTRVNFCDNCAQISVLAKVDQWAFSGTAGSTALTALYPAATPGTLTFNGNCASGQPLVDIGDDGFDSGGYVGNMLNVDGTGNGSVLIGYLGIGDAKNAAGAKIPTGGGAATYIKFNGYYESDTAVEQGSFSYWGYEHVLGTTTASSADAAAFAAGLVGGINVQVQSLGSATGDVSTNPSQSSIIPLSKMVVTRSGNDVGFPH